MRQLPALKVLIPFASGIFLSYWLTFSTLIIASSALVLTIAFFIPRLRRLKDTTLVALLMLSGMVSYDVGSMPQFESPIEVVLSGTITEPPVSDSRKTSFPLKPDQLQFEKNSLEQTNNKLWIRVKDDVELEIGDRVRCSGKIVSTTPQRNPGAFDIKSWRERNGFLGEVTVESRSDLELLSKSNMIRYRVVRWLDDAIAEQLPAHHTIIRSLVIGARRELDPEFVDDLRRSGLSHLFALSGLHIGFIAGIAYAILTLLNLPIRIRSFITILMIVMFCLLVPPRASTIRAAIMISIMIGGTILRRYSHWQNTISFAALIILIFRPGDLFDAGFQLSFAAITGILVVHDLFSVIPFTANPGASRSARWFNRYATRPLLYSVAATTMTIPIASIHFGMINLTTPLYNLVAIPLLGYIFVSSWLMLACALFSEILSGVVASNIDFVLSLFYKFIELSASTSLTIPYFFSPITVILISTVLLWFIVSSQRLLRRVVIVGFALSMIVLTTTGGHRSDLLRIWFLDVADGDAAICRLRDGRTMVIDAGRYRPDRNREGEVAVALRSMNVDQIDLAVATHPDVDHSGGFIPLVSSFVVKEAICAPVIESSLTWERLITESEANGIPWKYVNTSSIINLNSESITLRILNPPEEITGWNDNDASVVLQLQCHAPDDTVSILMTGDIERRAEQKLLSTFNLNADLIKIPHHGSNSSSTNPFLDAVQPTYAVVSRPGEHQSTRYKYDNLALDRYLDRGVRVYKTGEEGAILFSVKRQRGKLYLTKENWRKPKFLDWLLYGKQ